MAAAKCARENVLQDKDRRFVNTIFKKWPKMGKTARAHICDKMCGVQSK